MCILLIPDESKSPFHTCMLSFLFRVQEISGNQEAVCSSVSNHLSTGLNRHINCLQYFVIIEYEQSTTHKFDIYIYI